MFLIWFCWFAIRKVALYFEPKWANSSAGSLEQIQFRGIILKSWGLFLPSTCKLLRLMEALSSGGNACFWISANISWRNIFVISLYISIWSSEMTTVRVVLLLAVACCRSETTGGVESSVKRSGPWRWILCRLNTIILQVIRLKKCKSVSHFEREGCSSLVFVRVSISLSYWFSPPHPQSGS